MSKNVILVGCGNMGYAMLQGWLDAGIVEASNVTVVEPTEALQSRAANTGVNTVRLATELQSANADLIVFAVKPQIMRDLLPAYKIFSNTAAFLSVAAGISIATFEELLGAHAAIFRCMPNTPAAIGKGMMVVCPNAHVTPSQTDFVSQLLLASGEVAIISDETQMDAVTAVSGSGPAYVFHFIECLTSAALKAGLPQDTAKLLAMQTVYGAACLAKQSSEEPGRLREQVTSPNGTTAAALAIFMDNQRLETLVTDAVDAARLRSIELGK